MGSAYAKLERMKDIPAPAGIATARCQHATEDGWTHAYGTTVPTDATAGYAPGCLFQHVDGGAGEVLFVNEGTALSCDFNSTSTREFAPFAENTGRSYGFQVVGDNFFTGVAGAQEYLVHFEGSKDVVASGDAYGGILKISGGNDAVQTVAGYVFRGLNINTSNDGTLGSIESFIGTKNDEGTATNVKALTLRAENYGTMGASGTFGGLDIILTNEAAVAETEFGIRIQNTNNSIAGPVDAVIWVSETGANTGFTNFLKVPTAADLGITAATVEAAHVLGFDADGTAIKIPISVGGVTYYILAGTATALVADA